MPAIKAAAHDLIAVTDAGTRLDTGLAGSPDRPF